MQNTPNLCEMNQMKTSLKHMKSNETKQTLFQVIANELFELLYIVTRIIKKSNNLALKLLRYFT